MRNVNRGFGVLYNVTTTNSGRGCQSVTRGHHGLTTVAFTVFYTVKDRVQICRSRGGQEGQHASGVLGQEEALEDIKGRGWYSRDIYGRDLVVSRPTSCR